MRLLSFPVQPGTRIRAATNTLYERLYPFQDGGSNECTTQVRIGIHRSLVKETTRCKKREARRDHREEINIYFPLCVLRDLRGELPVLSVESSA
jgi:hypothetical protein